MYFHNNHVKVLYEIVAVGLWSKTLKNAFQEHLYSNTSIANISNKPMGNHI